MTKNQKIRYVAGLSLKLGSRFLVHPRSTVYIVLDILKRRRILKARALSYRLWFNNYQKEAGNVENQRQATVGFKHKPLISIILPIYNTNEEHLRACIDSVTGQSYDNWELCIVDDASTTDISKRIKPFIKPHKNIMLEVLDKNLHIAGASNEALKHAAGEFIALLDHDDLLMPNALFEMVKAINEHPDVDFFYSDEDKVDEGGRHIEPFFKPDWSPEYLYSCNYITHFSLLRRSLVKKIGGFRIGLEGAQDWDLFLRFVKESEKIHHVPKMLYSWRKSDTSTAKDFENKPYAYISQLQALRNVLSKDEEPASVYASPFMGFWHIKYHIQRQPMVSIVIPTLNNYELIKDCLESIIDRSTYANFEVLLIDTGTTDKATLDFYESKFIKSNPIRILKWDKEFNFSAVCNYGAAKAKGDYLLFLNNDTVVITRHWIEELLGHAQRKHVGMVGAKLLFPDKRIQHAGVVLTHPYVAFHAFYGVDPTLDVFMNLYISNTRNCAAVTGACAMVAKTKFEKAGGFDEELRVTFNDVDLCLRLLKAGYRNVYTPYAELFHSESRTVGRVNTEARDMEELKAATALMHQRWSDLLNRDPYYNDNFVQHGPDGYKFEA